MNKRKNSAALVIWLSVFMVLLGLFGLLLDQTVFRGREQYEDTPIPALPFVFFFDSAYHDLLAAEKMQEALVELPPIVMEVEYETGTAEEETEHTPEPAVVYEKGRVSPEYFADALFIGDSRTVGLSLYSAFAGADYFADQGMSVFSVFEKTSRDGETRLADLLSEKTYGKIYVMLGINEIGTNFDMIIKQYETVLARLKALAPDSVIVIQASLSVSETASQSAWYLTAERIRDLNKRQEALADGERVFFLDANGVFSDEEGWLKPELSGDGVHLYAKYYADWTAWMCENAYVPVPQQEMGSK